MLAKERGSLGAPNTLGYTEETTGACCANTSARCLTVSLDKQRPCPVGGTRGEARGLLQSASTYSLWGPYSDKLFLWATSLACRRNKKGANWLRLSSYFHILRQAKSIWRSWQSPAMLSPLGVAYKRHSSADNIGYLLQSCRTSHATVVTSRTELLVRNNWTWSLFPVLFLIVHNLRIN